MKRTIADYFGHKQRNVSETVARCDAVNVDSVAITVDIDGITPTDPPAKKKSYSFRKEWLKEFEWLRFENGAMHCAHCKACGPELAGKSAFATLSINFKHESLVKHGGSTKHQRCRDKCLAPTKSAPIGQAFDRQKAAALSAEEAELEIKFNTAYTIAKEELAFTKFKPLLSLQRKNGMDINMTYANDKSCANIIGVIADTLREQTAAKVASAQYMAFLIDGDTDVSVKECEIVYARILQNGQPTNVLVGHVEVQHANADGKIIIFCLKNFLHCSYEVIFHLI